MPYESPLPISTCDLIHRRLSEALSPTELVVTDDSPRHAGHVGAKVHGGGHYAIRIVSPVFSNLSRIARHRKIYDLLHAELQTTVHALKIDALSPEECL